LLKQKLRWENRIIALNGPNYKKESQRVVDAQGAEVPGSKGGYKYFGAAKQLPAVRELFELKAKEAEEMKKHKPHVDLFRVVDASYFALNENDAVLAEEEILATKALQQSRRQNMDVDVDSKQTKTESLFPRELDSFSPEVLEAFQSGDWNMASLGVLSQPLAIPDQDTIAALLLERRKQGILSEYS